VCTEGYQNSLAITLQDSG